MNLYRMPVEIMLFMADYLDPDDIFHLSLTCKGLKYLIHDRHICRHILLKYAPYSPEALRASRGGGGGGDFSRAFRIWWKRRRAVTTATPFTAAIIAQPDHYIYTNGVLCYTTDLSKLRVRDIRNSCEYESVIDVWDMLRSIRREVANLKSFIFYPIYYAHGMVSCIYSANPAGPSLLIVLDPQRAEIVVTRPVEGRPKVAVRNTDKFLFFCVCLPIGDRHDRRWHIYQFDIAKKKWFPEVVLEDFDGREFGGDICFEVLDGYFYAISDHLAHCLPNADPTDLDPHHVLRMPFSSSGLGSIEAALPRKDWKRNYSSDLADFRWNSMQLEKDEREGEPTVFQVRREFLAEGYHNRRTCYKKRLGFPRPSCRSGSGPGNADGQDDGSPVVDIVDDEVDDHDAGEGSEGEMADLILDSHSYQPEVRAVSTKSHVLLMPQPIELLDVSRNPLWPVPSTVHHGDNSTTRPQFPYHQCFVRSYFPSCESFVDLVNPSLRHTNTRQKLRLRIMTRDARPSSTRSRASSDPPKEVSKTLFWPSELESRRETPPGTSHHEESPLECLHNILNPPGYSGEVGAVADYGSLIYSVTQPADRHSRERKLLIYIGFDPSINLHTLEPFHKSFAKREGEKLHNSRQSPSEADRARYPPEVWKLVSGIYGWFNFEDCREFKDPYRKGFHFFP